jgi:hypothetical protein
MEEIDCKGRRGGWNRRRMEEYSMGGNRRGEEKEEKSIV